MELERGEGEIHGWWVDELGRCCRMEGIYETGMAWREEQSKSMRDLSGCMDGGFARGRS